MAHYCSAANQLDKFPSPPGEFVVIYLVSIIAALEFFVFADY